jgi:hypothetical protein
MGIPSGPWYINDLLTFTVNTHDVATGAGADAGSVPTYRVYEDETATAILTGSMAKLDDANTIGFYSEQLTLSAANGFEVGKSYSIYVTATVNSVAATQSLNFKVIATPASAPSAATVAAAVWAEATRTLTSLGNGSGLSAIPWNAAWDAEVQSEVTDALNAYDPPTKAELDAAVAPLATQASVNDLPTSAELTTALAGFSTQASLDAVAEQVDEVWRVLGLDPAAAVTITPIAMSASGISIAISGDGETTSTLTRAP